MARAKGIVWDDVPLGSEPDVDIARELGVAKQVVAAARRRRGIARCHSTPRPRSYDDWESWGLGEKPDSVVAQEQGVPRRTVAYVRQRQGIPPFMGLVLLQDGTPCRSVYEAMYDAVLHHHGTPHEHEVRFKELGVVADLVVEGVVVEIAGMDGFPRYDERRAKKEAIYREAGISVRWLTREQVEDAYEKVPLTIGTRERFCAECAVQTIDLVQGVCRPCRMKSWRSETAITVVCESCGKPYERAAADTKRRFCNRRCYWDSLELDWPSWEEIDRLIAETGNVSEVARMLGVKPATLNMRRLRRRRSAA